MVFYSKFFLDLEKPPNINLILLGNLHTISFKKKYLSPYNLLNTHLILLKIATVLKLFNGLKVLFVDLKLHVEKERYKFSFTCLDIHEKSIKI